MDDPAVASLRYQPEDRPQLPRVVDR